MNKSFQARQGDIFFETVDSIPTNLPLKSDLTLAYGEVTGHSHQVTSENKVECRVDNKTGDIFLRSPEATTVGHEEHKNINLPGGNQWVKVSRQREYDPLSESRQRQVAD